MLRRTSHGFTLIELVMVLVITGIIAAVAVPRFFDRQAFDARGFYDQTLAMVRYAQKVAVAQHTPVFVNISANVICLTYVADVGCVSAAGVQNPAEKNKFRTPTPFGVAFVTTPKFSFDALGRPLDEFGQPYVSAVVISINGDNIVRNITVERETGYVR